MQLCWILVHLGEGNAETVFWQIHHAFLDANAPAEYNMIAWAQGYHDHQLAHPHEHPPVVVQLSNLIMEWAQHPPEHHQGQAMQLAQPLNQPDAADGALDDAADGAIYNAADDTVDDGPEVDEESELQWLLENDFLLDPDFEPLDNLQAAQHASQDNSSDGDSAMANAPAAPQQPLGALVHDHARNLPGPSGHSHAQGPSNMQRGDPNLSRYYQSLGEEDAVDMQIDMQDSTQLSDMAAGMQASSSSQHGMVIASPLPAASGERGYSPESHVSASTQDFPLPNEQLLEQANLMHNELNMDTLEVPIDVQPGAEAEVTGAHLRSVLAAVLAEVDAVPPEQARMLVEVGSCIVYL